MALKKAAYNNAEGRPGVECTVITENEDGTVDLGRENKKTGKVELVIGSCQVGEGEGQCRLLGADGKPIAPKAAATKPDDKKE